jgi:hypothetical protein
MNDPLAMMMIVTGALLLAFVGFILVYALIKE